MTALNLLLDLPEPERQRLGLVHTAGEIARQPDCWGKTHAVIAKNARGITDFLAGMNLSANPNARIVLCGAGSSECVGQSVDSFFRTRFQFEADSRATTDCVTHFDRIFLPGREYLLVHFSRSGDSPESLRTYQLARNKLLTARQIMITCNSDGALAKTARTDPRSLLILLPEETNDRSLVMTSSVTSMIVAAMGLAGLAQHTQNDAMIERVCAGGRRTLGHADFIKSLAEQSWNRAAFLGSGPLLAVAREGQIKLTEITDGHVMCRYDSFVGFRHGPKVVLNSECVAVALVSTDRLARAYELDLLRELKNDRRAGRILAASARVDSELRSICPDALELASDDAPLDDDWAVPCHIMLVQLLGLFKSLALGLRPDNPCTSGVINRVVQGVRIHE